MSGAKRCSTVLSRLDAGLAPCAERPVFSVSRRSRGYVATAHYCLDCLPDEYDELAVSAMRQRDALDDAEARAGMDAPLRPDDPFTDGIWQTAGEVLSADLDTEEGRRAVVKAVRDAQRASRRVRLERLGVPVRRNATTPATPRPPAGSGGDGE